MAFLTKDQIFAFDDMTTTDVEMPEWTTPGQPTTVVRLKTLTGGERDKFESDSIVQRKGSGNTKMNLINLRARLIVLCAVDEQGRKMFGDSDVVKLSAKSSLAVNRLFEAAQKLNGMSQEDVDELVEGFDNDPSEDSTSG
jgi:hypothetical protein